MTSDSLPPSLVASTDSGESGRATARSTTSPGGAIRAARERAHLSIEELALQTRLARTTLEALERDDFDALNEPVYVRGYYRKCAKVLVLPEADLIAAYERLVVPKAPQAPTKLLIGSGPPIGRPSLGARSGSTRIAGVVAAIAVVTIVTALIWFRLNQPSVFAAGHGPQAPATTVPVATPANPPATLHPAAEASAPSSESPSSEVAPRDPTIASPGRPNAAASSAGAGIPGAPTITIPASPASAAATNAPARAGSTVPAGATLTASTALSTPGSLVLGFKSTSWIKVEDASGQTLLSGVIQGGDHQQLRGRPPYSVFLGNAPGVSIVYDGKPFDIGPYTKGNATARFTIP